MERVVLPQVSSIEEGKILRWLKYEGDTATKGESLVEIETSKVNIEVGSSCSGIVRQLLAKEGETIPAGAVIALVGEAAEPLPDPDSPLRQPNEAVQPSTRANGARGLLLFSLLILLLLLGIALLKELWFSSILVGVLALLLLLLLLRSSRRL